MRPATRNASSGVPARLSMPRAEAENRLSNQIKEGERLWRRPQGDQSELDLFVRETVDWSDFNEELLRRMFTSPEYADKYAVDFAVVGGTSSLTAQWLENRAYIDVKVQKLQSLLKRLELIPEIEPVSHLDSSRGLPVGESKKRVFIVHGHDNAIREEVARFLEKLSLEPVILDEQPNQGNTVIEKIEANADVAFATVLLTADDVGRSNRTLDEPRPRARQNVILELGFFMGYLGRAHVAALYEQGVELPSDYHGVLYIPLTGGESWMLRLAKELKKAGLDVDMNKLA
jgi:predicted nucleotide-binding protein